MQLIRCGRLYEVCSDGVFAVGDEQSLCACACVDTVRTCARQEMGDGSIFCHTAKTPKFWVDLNSVHVCLPNSLSGGSLWQVRCTPCIFSSSSPTSTHPSKSQPCRPSLPLSAYTTSPRESMLT